MTKKYSVNEAIWIATAVMAMEVYYQHDVVREKDYYFKQGDIVKRAQSLTNDKVDDSQVQKVCWVDKKKQGYNYLNGGIAFGKSWKRLSVPNEFPEKTYPESLDMSEKIKMVGKTITIEELFFFVKEQYPSIIKIEKKNLIYTDEYLPTLTEYHPGITKEKWIELLQSPNIVNEAILSMLYGMLELGGESTCTNLAEHYGSSVNTYNSLGRTLGKRVYKVTSCPLYKDREKEFFYTIPFVGRDVLEKGQKRYSWKLRSELKEALESDMLIDVKNKMKAFKSSKANAQHTKNMILYGPPGTGKTYNTAIYAVAICDELPIDVVQKMNYCDVRDRYKKLLSEDRIMFTTFHQSYGYEEFIEGIKPIVNDSTEKIGYKIEDGIFKKFCKTAILPNEEKIDYTSSVWKITLKQPGESDLKQECFEDGTIKFDWKSRKECEGTQDFYLLRQFQDKLKVGDIVVSYYGNKTDIDGIAIVTGEAIYDESKEQYRWSRSVKWIYQGEPISIFKLNNYTWFAGDKIYELTRVKVNELFDAVKSQSYVQMDKKYVFIIDEINRGNISKIFGELITLIEDTKRAGMEEEAVAVLPYSGESFSVPSNVYLLGTMNTADRSIALMDTALRRRFEFVEMLPDADILRKIGADKVGDLDVALMLETINERITFLYDREHTIGHAFFTKLAENPTLDTLKSIFEKSVIPLLQEYFYEDYQKIQLVLGDNGKKDDAHKFVLDSNVKVKDVFKGRVDDVIDLPEKKYSINDKAFDNIESYKEII